LLTVTSALGVRSDPLSLGWCEFCSAEARLYRAVFTGMLTYLILLYVPEVVKPVWRVLQRRMRKGEEGGAQHLPVA
jgi:hypothetical protein